jgi:Tat protein translocase TatB subunit
MSFLETVVILVVAVVVLGPNRLPEAARKLGRFMGMVREAGEAFKRQLMAMDEQVAEQSRGVEEDLDCLVPEDEVAAGAKDVAPGALVGSQPMSAPVEVWDVPPAPHVVADEVKGVRDGE